MLASTPYTMSSAPTVTSLKGNVRVSATAPVVSSRRSMVQRILVALPRSFEAHALSMGSASARGDELVASQPGLTAGLPLNSTMSRCVSAVPVRGVRMTSSSGGGASPCAMALSVAATRDGLPRATW